MRVTPPILGVTGGVIERGQRKFQEVFTKLCNFSTSFKAKKPRNFSSYVVLCGGERGI